MRLEPTTPCSSCGAPMYWAVVLSGKRIPLDPDPAEDGNLCEEDGLYVFVEPLLHGDVPRYKSHFATCPHADRHRRRR